MYMATVHIILDLEPEVSTSDREKVLRSIRDRLRQVFGQKITVRTDDEASLWVVWLDDSFPRLEERLDDVLERVESAGQARVLNHTEQWFAWHEGHFVETGTIAQELEDEQLTEHSLSSTRDFMPPRSAFLTDRSTRNRFEKTIIYHHEDELEGRSALGSSTRRQIRLPTRK
jgi:hypothetical protein